MTQEPFFDFNPTPDPDAWSFWVRVKTTDFEAAKMPQARVTTYAQFLLKVEGAACLEGYGSYYYIEATSAATPQYFRFYFAASSTSNSLVGKSYQSERALPPSQFISSQVIQSTSQVVPYGTTPDSTSDVLDSKVEPINGIISRLNTNAVLSYSGTPLYSWLLDPDTGKGYLVAEQVVAAGTEGSEEVAADGTFSDVRPVNAFWSIKTTKKTNTLPNAGNPRVWTKTERSPVAWPDVMVGYQLLPIVEASAQYAQKLFFYTTKVYQGDVQVEYREWWQKEAPAALSPVEMIATAISLPRMWSPDISVPPTLHPAISVNEPIIMLDESGIAQTVEAYYNVPATNYTDWPSEIPKLDADPFQGGFRCLKRIIQKPQGVIAEMPIAYGPWLTGDYDYENYP